MLIGSDMVKHRVVLLLLSILWEQYGMSPFPLCECGYNYWLPPASLLERIWLLGCHASTLTSDCLGLYNSAIVKLRPSSLWVWMCQLPCSMMWLNHFALVGQLCIVVVVQWLALHPFCRVSWCVWFGVYSGTCLFVQWSLCQSKASELCSLFWQMELSVRCLDHLSMYPCHCQCYSWWVDYNLIQHWNTSCVESCDCSFHRWCFHLSMHLQTLASQHWLFIGPLASQDVLLPSWVARTLLIITLICSRNSLHL